ncbi:MAG TPA: MlaD family protein [Bacteroidales bacterium]|nr:MlaD family protein [Bacteroidales bacterium]HPT22121.1 MlaD family protein [Bacteroidales bacterium]
MKKISNEVKVGFTALVTILLFIWMYSFLKGKDFFSNSAYYYTVYDQVGGLSESSPVEVNGYKVGVVQSIDFIDAESGKLLVEFSVDRNFKLPKNTVAEITPISIMGGVKVQFVYGKGPGTYSEGDTIPGRVAESLLDKVDNELVPVFNKLENLITNLDSVITSVNDIIDSDFKKNLDGTIANLNGTTKSLNSILGSEEKDLKETLNNINRFSKMLSDNSGKLDSTLTNLESISDTLAAADIYTSVANLKTSLENASSILDKLNKGKGTAGQILTNDTLYTNLSSSLESLNILLQDIKTNPKRYVHFSLFGKKSPSGE